MKSVTIDLPNTIHPNVSIYPDLPFLGKGERVIWNRQDIQEKYILKLDVITDCRIIQYNFEKCHGNSILLRDLKEIKITKTNSIDVNNGNITIEGKRYQEDVVDDYIGDLIFIDNSDKMIKFKEINNVTSISNLVKKIKYENYQEIRTENILKDLNYSNTQEKIKETHENDLLWFIHDTCAKVIKIAQSNQTNENYKL